MRLSYSRFKCYDCPLKYRWLYVDKRKYERQSMHNAVYGICMHKIFEKFYNLNIWKKRGEAASFLMKNYKKYCDEALAKEYINWKSPGAKSKKEIFKEVEEGLLKGIEIVKREKLLGEVAESEIKMKGWVKNNILNGIIDYHIIRNGEILILDGKGTNWKKSDKDQILFYALLYYLQNSRIPDKIGFWYFRFGEVVWHEVRMEEIKGLVERLKIFIRNVQLGNFGASPSLENCKFCVYKSNCPEAEKVELGDAGIVEILF